LQEIALTATAEEAAIVEATEVDGVAHLAEADHPITEEVVAETEVTVVKMDEPRSNVKVYVSCASKRATSREIVLKRATVVVDLGMREEMMIEYHVATETIQDLPVQDGTEADATLPQPEDETLLPLEIEGPEITLGQDLLQNVETRP